MRCRKISVKKGLMAGTLLALTFLLYMHHQDDRFTRIEINFPKLHNDGDSDAEVTLDDVFISVKTSGKFHSDRIDPILRTWWTAAKDQTYIFTDVDDKHLFNVTGGHMINTKCGTSHKTLDLCCKMGYEYDAFAQSGRKWWCHFDDDNYVNVDNLLKILREYDWKSKIYLGKKSVNHSVTSTYMRIKSETYWFLTGGAGVCISKGLRDGMDVWCGNGNFRRTCKKLDGPDDTTLGFIVNNRLGVGLTERREFNSHFNDLRIIPNDQLSSQVTVSYRLGKGEERLNIITLDEEKALFNMEQDPTRFLSFHCMLYPNTDWCSTKQNI